MIVLTVYVKLFGLVAFALFLLYPGKVRSILYAVFWFAAVGALPLLFISFSQLITTYQDWGVLLASDHDSSKGGMSVMGWIWGCFHVHINKLYVVSAGALLFILPLLRFDLYKDITYRLLFLASVLIWIVIFNHKGESPTYVIAVAGVAIWYFIQEKSVINNVLVIFCFLFTCLSPTDIFPSVIREKIIDVYVLKMFPCFLIWLKMMYELSFEKYEPQTHVTNSLH